MGPPELDVSINAKKEQRKEEEGRGKIHTQGAKRKAKRNPKRTHTKGVKSEVRRAKSSTSSKWEHAAPPAHYQ